MGHEREDQVFQLPLARPPTAAPTTLLASGFGVCSRCDACKRILEGSVAVGPEEFFLNHNHRCQNNRNNCHMSKKLQANTTRPLDTL